MIEIKNGNKTTYKITEKESDDEELKDLTTSNRGSMGYTDISKEEWNSIFKKRKEIKMKIIKFSASWCGKCRQIKSEWDKLKESYPQVEFVEIDCDNCSQQMIDKYSVKDLPTIVWETEDKLKEWNVNENLTEWVKKCVE